MDQVTVSDILGRGERLALRCVAGSPDGVAVSGVAIVELAELPSVAPGQLVIVTTPDHTAPRAYQVDIAIRRAIAAGCAGLVFVEDFPLAATSRALADRGGLPVLMSTASPSELAVLMDRAIRGGAEEALSRVEQAIARATAAADPTTAGTQSGGSPEAGPAAAGTQATRSPAAGPAAGLAAAGTPTTRSSAASAAAAGTQTTSSPAADSAAAGTPTTRSPAASSAAASMQTTGSPVAGSSAAVLAEAGAALGVRLTLVEDPTVAWSSPAAVCVGEVPVGRLTADREDTSVAIALPVVAAVFSRALQREWADRFGPVRSRADLIVELVYAESSRLDSLAVEATRAGLPVALSHAVAWLTPTHRADPARRPPTVLTSSVELHALQLVHGRAEVWHLATIHDDVVLVASEEAGAPDHQRRLRDVMESVVSHAGSVAGDEWVFTVGLGTPQNGAAGLRQSATEARVAAESAVAGGRAGGVSVTDVTGLRRVLLDIYASSLSRSLLDDVLSPLDTLGPERAEIAARTLLAYLGHRNSLARAAQELNLHPNAVNYRVRRIEQTLGLDLTEPDVRFAVELACRVRLIASRR